MNRVFTGALIIAASSMFSVAAMAQETSSEAATEIEVATNETEEQTETAADEDRTVCRRVRVTGSHRIQRVCMTQSQWTAESDRGRESLRDQGNLSNINEGAQTQQ